MKGEKDQGVQVKNNSIANPAVTDRLHTAFDELVGVIDNLPRFQRHEQVDNNDWTKSKGEAA